MNDAEHVPQNDDDEDNYDGNGDDYDEDDDDADYDNDDIDDVGMSGILFWATILLERHHFPCFFNQLLLQF